MLPEKKNLTLVSSHIHYSGNEFPPYLETSFTGKSLRTKEGYGN